MLAGALGEHALAAARGAVRRMGYEQAARYYRWALDAGAGDRLSTMLELGEALVLAGELKQGRAFWRRWPRWRVRRNAPTTSPEQYWPWAAGWVGSR